MTGPIDPLSKVGGRRQHRRRASDPPPADVEGANLPVPVGPVTEEPRERRASERETPRTPRQPAATTLNAHLIGQENRRRGLRAGQPALDVARATYLGAEYSGPADRRPRPGRITKTEI